jgi:hypothetical protein
MVKCGFTLKQTHYLGGKKLSDFLIKRILTSEWPLPPVPPDRFNHEVDVDLEQLESDGWILKKVKTNRHRKTGQEKDLFQFFWRGGSERPKVRQSAIRVIAKKEIIETVRCLFWNPGIRCSEPPVEGGKFCSIHCGKENHQCIPICRFCNRLSKEGGLCARCKKMNNTFIPVSYGTLYHDTEEYFVDYYAGPPWVTHKRQMVVTCPEYISGGIIVLIDQRRNVLSFTYHGGRMYVDNPKVFSETIMGFFLYEDIDFYVYFFSPGKKGLAAPIEYVDGKYSFSGKRELDTLHRDGTVPIGRVPEELLAIELNREHEGEIDKKLKCLKHIPRFFLEKKEIVGMKSAFQEGRRGFYESGNLFFDRIVKLVE